MTRSPVAASIQPGDARARIRTHTVHTGQIVVAELAVVAVLVGATTAPGWLLVAAPVALLTLLTAVIRVRRRWLYQWLGQALGFARRPRTMPAGSPPEALLELVSPGSAITAI